MFSFFCEFQYSRIDAEHNETCFQNPDGSKIDLDKAASQGFNIDVPVEVNYDIKLFYFCNYKKIPDN